MANLQEAGQDPFQITKYDVTHHTSDVKEVYTAHEEELLAGRPEVNTDGMDEAEAKEATKKEYEERRSIMDASPIQVSIAGRMMFKRVMGKASFCKYSGSKEASIQCYVARDSIGEDAYTSISRNMDIGDICRYQGYTHSRTKTGEISIHAAEMTLLSKSLTDSSGEIPRPDEYRYPLSSALCRSDHEPGGKGVPLLSVLRLSRRSVTSSMDRDFMEVETPMLVANAGGAAARPFETHYNALE